MKKKNNILKVCIFIIVLLIPIIYSFFYLKSYWDPYGNLTDIKIAIVNLDKGNTEENQGKEFVDELKDDGTFNIQDVSLEDANKGLQDGSYYAMIMIPENFTEYLNSAKEENKQVATITYTPNKATNYLATQIINSAMKTIETNLRSKVSSKVVDTLANNIKDVPNSLQDVSDGTQELLDGTTTLSNGLKELSDGTTTLSNNYKQFDEGVTSAYQGSTSLNSGISQVNNGVNTLSDGGKQLDGAMEQINNGTKSLLEQGGSGVQQLQSGISTLNSGATSLNEGINTYVTGTTKLSNGILKYVEGAKKVENGLPTYVSQVNNLADSTTGILKGILAYCSANPTALSDATMQQLYGTAKALLMNTNGTLKEDPFATLKTAGNQLSAGATQLSKSNDELENGANSLINSANTVTTGANSLKEGTDKLVSSTSNLSTLTNGIATLQKATEQVEGGIDSLNSGISSLKNGTTTLKNGSETLSEGLAKLDSSSKTIDGALNTISTGSDSAYNGSIELIDGINTLKTGVDDGITKANEEIKKLNGLSDFVENPVEFKEESYGEVSSYGIAFTPLFLCIGLWVGALMCYVVLYYDQKNRFGVLDSNEKNKFLQNAIYLAIGVLDGLVTSFLLKHGLGLNIENTALYYGASIVIGITFMSIIQFLIRNFGDVGKLLALIILVLQLAAAGGTFPVETIDKGFRALNPFLPMTYTIKLLKEILVPSATNYKGQYFAILIGISVVCIAITYIVDIIRNNKEKKAEANEK